MMLINTIFHNVIHKLIYELLNTITFILSLNICSSPICMCVQILFKKFCHNLSVYFVIFHIKPPTLFQIFSCSFFFFSILVTIFYKLLFSKNIICHITHMLICKSIQIVQTWITPTINRLRQINILFIQHHQYIKHKHN